MMKKIILFLVTLIPVVNSFALDEAEAKFVQNQQVNKPKSEIKQEKQSEINTENKPGSLGSYFKEKLHQIRNNPKIVPVQLQQQLLLL